jgi:hypothetical protein
MCIVYVMAYSECLVFVCVLNGNDVCWVSPDSIENEKSIHPFFYIGSGGEIKSQEAMNEWKFRSSSQIQSNRS